MGLRTASVSEPDTAVLAWLTAVIVTVLGEGIALGGVYRPLEEIVPVAADPAATPFTSQVTAVFEVFATVADSCTVEPRRTCEPPVTVTVMTGCGGVEGGLVVVLPPPEQPAI
jgi:hypothetical protein